jgi:hypothetical protein
MSGSWEKNSATTASFGSEIKLQPGLHETTSNREDLNISHELKQNIIIIAKNNLFILQPPE